MITFLKGSNMKRQRYQFHVVENQENLDVAYEVTEEDQVVYIQVHVQGNGRCIETPIVCMVKVPACQVYEIWTPKINLIKALNLDWFMSFNRTNAFTGAPVQSLIGLDNSNRATLGISDTLNTIGLQTVPVEETGEYAFTIELLPDMQGQVDVYQVTFRLDLRDIPYYRALEDTARWWEEKEDYPVAKVPPFAKEPMYSTWYSYHQKLDEESLLIQCDLAAQIGCGSILIDDGWQTEDNKRGYAHCGDWQCAPSKIPDMAEFVKKVHKKKMKVLSWYSLPFIGRKSNNFQQFKDMIIDPEAKREWHVLDPRYPKVRQFIISLFEKALEEWDLDGFKMDFIDEFVVTPFSGIPDDPRRDYESFHDATDCLMRECIDRLKRKKDHIMLEFRQTYNGPRMRTYGNIFRAVDCPLDSVENRVRVTDIRLLCGNTAVHSDMLMWNERETPESAALQIINVLFSVPQISMRLDQLSLEHREMVDFYFKLWKKYQNAFINGTFEPLNPAARYNIIIGRFERQLVCAYHTQELIQIEEGYQEMIFVNGSGKKGLVLEYQGSSNSCQVEIINCRGKVISREKIVLTNCVRVFPAPQGAVVVIIFQKNI